MKGDGNIRYSLIDQMVDLIKGRPLSSPDGQERDQLALNLLCVPEQLVSFAQDQRGGENLLPLLRCECGHFFSCVLVAEIFWRTPISAR